MPKLLIIAITVFSVISLVYFSKSMTWTLNLVTGKAEASYSIAGITYTKVTNVHNPTQCPVWENPEKETAITSISYTCYEHIPKLKSCINAVKLYEATYNRGCNI